MIKVLSPFWRRRFTTVTANIQYNFNRNQRCLPFVSLSKNDGGLNWRCYNDTKKLACLALASSPDSRSLPCIDIRVLPTFLACMTASQSKLWSFFVLTSIRVLQIIHSRVSLSLLCISTFHNISEITFVIYHHFSSSAASCWVHIPHAITTWLCCRPQFGLITWSSHGYWHPTSAHRLFMNINQLSHGMVFLRWLVEAHDVIIHTPYLGTLNREIPNRLIERKMVFPQ